MESKKYSPDGRSERDAPIRFAAMLHECFRSELFLTKEANSVIYAAGQKDSSIYLIDQGSVKLRSYSENGKTCILGIYSSGDIFGESCVLSPVRRETATAMTDVRLKRIPHTRFMEAVATGSLVDEWSRYQTRRLQEHHEIVTLHVTVDSMQRLAAVLLKLAERLGIPHGGRTVIVGRLTHEDLAQMVGTTRSRIGFFLKQLQKGGMVSVSRDSHLAVEERRLREFMAARARKTA